MALTNPIMASLFYVACSRAKHCLYVFLQQDDPKVKQVQSALEEVEKAGALVINKDISDYEFCGVITHYNPERLGLLRVQDAAFDKASIQFFPSDVEKSGIKDLKVGSKIRFRPRLEGHITIACDLILVQENEPQ